MDNKKEVERAELHRTIWKIADSLRGSIDGWDFKAYVLGMLFYRYASENLNNHINKNERDASNDMSFNYADQDDEMIKQLEETINFKTSIIEEKGFFLLPSQLFNNVLKNCRNNENLNTNLKDIFNAIENSSQGHTSEETFKGLFVDLDLTSNKLGTTVKQRNQKLVELLEGIGSLSLGEFSDNTIDAFGDAYEFLMTMYASSAGKSGGEFYTPPEASELLARLTVIGKKEVNKVYDPACGSGSLLLKFAKILGPKNVRNGFFGQEKNPTTFNLCRINMFLHDIDWQNINIAQGDTLLDPQHDDDEPFEAIVSNPPYSISWIGSDDEKLINDERYAPAGVLAPKSKADLAFIMHTLSYLADDGVAAIVCFPGIFYRGGAEKKIRQYLVEHNFVDAIIELPNNLFYGTNITTDILILKKSRKPNDVLFINASKEFVKITNNNKLSQENIENILKIYTDRKDIQYKAKVVSLDEIKNEDFNLSINTYVEKENLRKNINIEELNKSLIEVVKKENELRDSINKIIENIESFDKSNNEESEEEHGWQQLQLELIK